jgi:RNA polymerase sigma factor (sigma-70 family)
MVFYSDEALLRGLKNRRTECIRQLYREYFPVTRSLVERNSGNYEDAEDVFQDSLIVLYEKICADPVSLNCSLKTYFYSICKNIWMQRLDRKWRLLYREEMVHEPSEDYDPLAFSANEEKLERTRLYHQYFTSLPEDCQKIIRLFLDHVPFKEIAEEMGFKTVAYAKTRKYLCKNMLRKKILNDPRYKSFFHYEEQRKTIRMDRPVQQ